VRVRRLFASLDRLTPRKASRALLGWTAGAAVPTWFWRGRDLTAAYADVFESHSTQADGVQQVFSIHDERAAKHLLDAGEVEAAKFRPARADD